MGYYVGDQKLNALLGEAMKFLNVATPKPKK